MGPPRSGHGRGPPRSGHGRGPPEVDMEEDPPGSGHGRGPSRSGHGRGPPWKWTQMRTPLEMDMEDDPLSPEVDTEEDPPGSGGGRGPVEKYCWASRQYALEKGFLVWFIFFTFPVMPRYRKFYVSVETMLIESLTQTFYELIIRV